MQKSSTVAAVKDPDYGSSGAVWGLHVGCRRWENAASTCSMGCSPLRCPQRKNAALTLALWVAERACSLVREFWCFERQCYRKVFMRSYFGQIVFKMVSQGICSFYLDSLSIASCIDCIYSVTEKTVIATEHCNWSLQSGFFS